jgi:hypothetical protein
MVGVPLVVRVPQLEKPCCTEQRSLINIFILQTLVKCKDNVFPVNCMKTYMWSTGIAPLIRFGTGWR